MTPADIRARLGQIADECEERARWAPVGSYERSAFNHWAAEARKVACNRNYDESDLRVAHTLASAVVNGLRGEDDGAPHHRCEHGRLQDTCGQCRPSSIPTVSPQGSHPPPDALNPRQLAELFGMSERGARKAVERWAGRCLPGFYRDGCHLFADREAFALQRSRCRIGAECGEGDRRAA